MKLPVIDLSKPEQVIAQKINEACTNTGFFYIKNHGISVELQSQLETISKRFFELPLATKMEIEMALSGLAWRGFFPVMRELTSGKPDLKEGLYFGEELASNHPKVAKKMPLHGQNLFPAALPEMKTIVLNFIKAITKLSHQLMEYISLSLGLEKTYFKEHFTKNPLTLFRIFHYPPTSTEIKKQAPWGVGEHTDYGLFTILKQDSIGGLQVKSNNQWIDAPFIENTFICNIGDMLDKLTDGYYISTPHRVLNNSGEKRYSFPFFFDPNVDAKLNPINLTHLTDFQSNSPNRWDGQNLNNFSGTYGDYILSKVGKVFPNLLK